MNWKLSIALTFFAAGLCLATSRTAGAEPAAEGPKRDHPVLDQPAYPGITLLKREKGSVPWNEAIPAHWQTLRSIIAKQPRRLAIPFYVYEGEKPPSVQHAYRSYQALKYDDQRCVGAGYMTKGSGETTWLDYKMWYRVSTDGGKTYDKERPLIQSGEGYSPMHPIKYVHVGKNGFVYASSPPLVRMTNGEILMPFYFWPLDEKGEWYNPGGGWTFSYAGAMVGKWNEAGDDVVWEVSQEIPIAGGQSSRGVSECAVVELSTPGHIFMVMRGSNHPNPKGTIPAVKWKTLSTDYGRTWSKCAPFTYSDGEEFL